MTSRPERPLEEDAVERRRARFAPEDESTVDTFTREVAPRVRALFFELVPGQIDSIAEAADPEERAKAVHKLKGSCLAVGAQKMVAACESLGSEREDEVVAELIEALRASFGALRER